MNSFPQLYSSTYDWSINSAGFCRYSSSFQGVIQKSATLVNTEQVTAVSSNNVNGSLSIYHGFPVFVTIAKKDDTQITKSRTIEEDIEAVKDEWIAERIIAAFGREDWGY